MIVLSIDVGMKNLAHCLLTVEESKVEILDWDVVDLTMTAKCFKCVKSSVVTGEFGAACKKHQPSYVVTGMKKSDLEELCTSLALSLGSREEMAKRLTEYKKTSPHISTTVSRGRELSRAYAKFVTPDVVLVENQMAAKMAVVQGMVTQYWIERGAATIEAVSPVHKLKGLGKTTYAERKKAGVEKTRTMLGVFGLDASPLDARKKKDDLADTFLQAMWYLENKGLLRTT
jgi:hypothetical protein